jgi:hypothetical protein
MPDGDLQDGDPVRFEPPLLLPRRLDPHLARQPQPVDRLAGVPSLLFLASQGLRRRMQQLDQLLATLGRDVRHRPAVIGVQPPLDGAPGDSHRCGRGCGVR